MPLVFWKEDTLKVLRRHTGPAADELMQRCTDKVRIRNSGMTAANYFRFLRSLGPEIPGSVDRGALLKQLKKNAFGRICDRDSPLPQWQAQSREILQRALGPVGGSIADEAESRIPESINRSTVGGFLEFIDALERMIPIEADVEGIIGAVKRRVLMQS